jgi:hypothetical protein
VFVVLLIAMGIFFPTFVRQIVDGKFVAAVLVVLVLWTLHYLTRVRPYDPVVIARQRAREEARLARVAKRVAATAPAAPPAAPTDQVTPSQTQDKPEGGAGNA